MKKEPCGSFLRADNIRPYTNCVFFVGDGAPDVPHIKTMPFALQKASLSFPTGKHIICPQGQTSRAARTSLAAGKPH